MYDEGPQGSSVFDRFTRAHPYIAAICFVIAMPTLMLITIIMDNSLNIPHIADYRIELIYVSISGLVAALGYLVYRRFTRHWISKPCLALAATLTLMNLDLMKHFDGAYPGHLSHYFIFQPKGIMFFIGVFIVICVLAFFAPKKDKR